MSKYTLVMLHTSDDTHHVYKVPFDLMTAATRAELADNIDYHHCLFRNYDTIAGPALDLFHLFRTKFPRMFRLYKQITGPLTDEEQCNLVFYGCVTMYDV